MKHENMNHNMMTWEAGPRLQQPMDEGRRRFLKTMWKLGLGLAGVGGGVVFFRSRPDGAPDVIHAYDSVWHVDFDQDEETLSFREMMQLMRRMNRLYDAIPEDQRRIEITKETMREWVREIVPMFVYNGAADNMRYPSETNLENYTSAQAHNHVLGSSDCKNYITLNARVDNPQSSWYHRPMFLTATAHELAHVQQGEEVCNSANRDNVETTAQVVTWEVLANMASSDNRMATVALVDELFDVTLGVARLSASREKRLDEFDALLHEVNPAFFEYAPFDRAMRYWKDRPAILNDILRRYYEMPLLAVVNASRFTEGNIDGLALPPVTKLNEREWYAKPQPRTFVIDDFIYFMDHAESAVSNL